MRWLACVKQAGASVGDLVIPRLCASCGRSIGVSEDVVCEGCSRELSRLVGGSYCRKCGNDREDYLLADGVCTRCLTHRSVMRFDGFAKVGPYRGPLQKMLLRFKRESALDRLLGRWLRDAIAGRFGVSQIDWWVPIPSHWRRRVSRGFQPTALLARAVSRDSSGRHVPALVATRYVAELHRGMSFQERRRTVRGAFGVRRGISLKGRVVCVIDDVTTTGATLAEAGRVLRVAGVNKVFAAVVAKTAS